MLAIVNDNQYHLHISTSGKIPNL